MEVHHHSHTARKKWTHFFWEFFMLFLAVSLHNLRAIVNELRSDNYYMLSFQAPRLKAIAEELMNYLHEKYHLK
jgi:hypothetical protein